MTEAQITILGSGTSTGVPVPGCSCPVCSSQDPRDRRTRCSLLIACGGRNILIDTATDLRHQALREGIAHVDAVLYTHTHADHIHGIDDLRAFCLTNAQAIPIFGSEQTIATIRRNFSYIFDEELEPGWRPRLEPRVVAAPFELFGLFIEPLLLYHGKGLAQGYRIGPLAYLTDCNALPEATEEALKGVEVLVIDGLRFRPHASHFNIAQAVEVGQRLGARRTLLTHLAHDVDHRRHGAQLPEGVELAYDGLRLCLTLPSAD